MYAIYEPKDDTEKMISNDMVITAPISEVNENSVVLQDSFCMPNFAINSR